MANLGELGDAPPIDDPSAPFHDVRIHGRGVVVRRTARPFESVEQLTRAFHSMYEPLEGHDLARMTLLIDLRDVVGRNDPAFEQAIAPLRRALMERFAHVGLLVLTTVGMLQVRRHLAADGLHADVFSDADAAFAWLRRVTEGPSA